MKMFQENVEFHKEVELNDNLMQNGKAVTGRPYKIYTAIFSHFSTDAPTVEVLENTIGNIVWSRNAEGDFAGTLAGAFPANKTIAFIQPARHEHGGTTLRSATIYWNTEDNVMVLIGSMGVDVDYVYTTGSDQSVQLAIEIRVYP